MNRGENIQDISRIPVTITYPEQVNGNFRYVVIVRIKDRVSGIMRESLQEIFADIPMSPEQIRAMAVQNMMQGMGNDTITGALGQEVSWGEPRATITSVSRRV
jgi:hypothetical protein